MKIKVVLESAGERGYTVYVPSLPCCISEGDTFDGAMKVFLSVGSTYNEKQESFVS